MLTIGEQKRALYDAACALHDEKKAEVVESIASSYFHNDLTQADSWLFLNERRIKFVKDAMVVAAKEAIEKIYEFR
jgi:hypothetical protein